jgi:hypothetical protein
MGFDNFDIFVRGGAITALVPADALGAERAARVRRSLKFLGRAKSLAEPGDRAAGEGQYPT